MIHALRAHSPAPSVIRGAHFLAAGFALALAACGGGGGGGGGGDATAPVEAAASGIYVGFFYNTSARAGGTVGAALDTTAGSVTGSWDFTQGDAEPITLCGAGNVNLSRSAGSYTGTFTSDDTDPGCGFDKGAVFTLTGTIDSPVTTLSGNYSLANAAGSNIASGVGVYDVWNGGPKTIQVCTGTMSVPVTSANAAASPVAAVAVYMGEKTVSGAAVIQNYDLATGVSIADCVTNFEVNGLRGGGATPMELKLNAINRSGTACTSTTASGNMYFGGSITATTLTATGTGGANPPSLSLTCKTDPV